MGGTDGGGGGGGVSGGACVFLWTCSCRWRCQTNTPRLPVSDRFGDMQVRMPTGKSQDGEAAKLSSPTPGARDSGELDPGWLDSRQAERALRMTRHELLPVGGRQCLVVVAPSIHAPEFNSTSVRRLGFSKKAFRARDSDRSPRIEKLVHWVVV